MTGTTRIPCAEIKGVQGALVKYAARKKVGKVPDSLGVAWHHRKVLSFSFGLGRKTKKWNACPQDLKAFAHMAVATQMGCSACLDLGYYEAHHLGLDMAKARHVPQWRETASVFTPLELSVLEYAEAMSHTPPTVTDELSASLLGELGPAALIELTAFIALANYYSRMNTALGVESAGLSASCEIELPQQLAAVDS